MTNHPPPSSPTHGGQPGPFIRSRPSPSLLSPGRVNEHASPRAPPSPFSRPRFRCGPPPPTWGRCPEEVAEEKGRAWRPTESRGSGLWPPARRPACLPRQAAPPQPVPLTRLWDESLKRPGRETEMGVSGGSLGALQKCLGPTPHRLPQDGILTSCPGTRCLAGYSDSVVVCCAGGGPGPPAGSGTPGKSPVSLSPPLEWADCLSPGLGGQ